MHLYFPLTELVGGRDRSVTLRPDVCRFWPNLEMASALTYSVKLGLKTQKSPLTARREKKEIRISPALQ